ncbi:MAG TPA: hypothetical protein VF528_04390 [Pyrinomonadaceae bacterium]|jgi:hypothetical protein
MKRLFRVALLFSLLIFAASVVHACRCPRVKPQKKLKESSAVFIGEVVEIGEDVKGDCSAGVKFKVEKYWKGVNEPFITVYTTALTCFSGCAVPVEVGKKFLVYAHRYGDGRLGMVICTTSLIGGERAVEELKVIGKGKVFKQ